MCMKRLKETALRAPALTGSIRLAWEPNELHYRKDRQTSTTQRTDNTQPVISPVFIPTPIMGGVSVRDVEVCPVFVVVQGEIWAVFQLKIWPEWPLMGDSKI